MREEIEAEISGLTTPFARDLGGLFDRAIGNNLPPQEKTMSYSAIRARTALLVLLPCTIFSVRVAKADPTTPPPSPFHEILIADDLNNIGTSRLRGECDLINGSTFHFVATGRAVGPYPGTFVERGTFELSPALPSTFGNIVINVTS